MDEGEILSYLKENFYYEDGHLCRKHDSHAKWRAGYKISNVSRPDGYGMLTIGGKRQLVHRMIFLFHNGWLPDLVDHKDRDCSNNHIENLRAADKRINAINTGLPSNNKSGVKGVCWSKVSQKWSAQIKHRGKKIHLGVHDDIEDATKARKAAEEELWHDIG